MSLGPFSENRAASLSNAATQASIFLLRVVNFSTKKYLMIYFTESSFFSVSLFKLAARSEISEPEATCGGT